MVVWSLGGKMSDGEQDAMAIEEELEQLENLMDVSYGNGKATSKQDIDVEVSWGDVGNPLERSIEYNVSTVDLPQKECSYPLQNYRLNGGLSCFIMQHYFATQLLLPQEYIAPWNFTFFIFIYYYYFPL